MLGGIAVIVPTAAELRLLAGEYRAYSEGSSVTDEAGVVGAGGGPRTSRPTGP